MHFRFYYEALISCCVSLSYILIPRYDFISRFFPNIKELFSHKSCELYLRACLSPQLLQHTTCNFICIIIWDNKRCDLNFYLVMDDTKGAWLRQKSSRWRVSGQLLYYKETSKRLGSSCPCTSPWMPTQGLWIAQKNNNHNSCGVIGTACLVQPASPLWKALLGAPSLSHSLLAPLFLPSLRTSQITIGRWVPVCDKRVPVLSLVRCSDEPHSLPPS